MAVSCRFRIYNGYQSPPKNCKNKLINITVQTAYILYVIIAYLGLMGSSLALTGIPFKALSLCRALLSANIYHGLFVGLMIWHTFICAYFVALLFRAIRVNKALEIDLILILMGFSIVEVYYAPRLFGLTF